VPLAMVPVHPDGRVGSIQGRICRCHKGNFGVQAAASSGFNLFDYARSPAVYQYQTGVAPAFSTDFW
jgi:hypothetical protein